MYYLCTVMKARLSILNVWTIFHTTKRTSFNSENTIIVYFQSCNWRRHRYLNEVSIVSIYTKFEITRIFFQIAQWNHKMFQMNQSLISRTLTRKLITLLMNAIMVYMLLHVILMHKIYISFACPFKLSSVPHKNRFI